MAASHRDRRLVGLLIVAIAAVNGASVVLFWGDSGTLAARLAVGVAVAVGSYLGGRVIAS